MSWKDLLKKNVSKGASEGYFPTAGKIAGSAKALAGKAAPLVGKAAGAASTTAAAAGASVDVARGALVGAGAATGASIVNAIADPGFVLFIAGALTFWLSESFNLLLAILIATFFMFYTSIFIFKGKGFFVTIIFWLWYIVFGGISDPYQIIFTIIPIILVSMLLHGIVGKLFQHSSFTESAGSEAAGILPILLFFLDLGLLEFLTKPPIALTLHPLVSNIMLYAPWWALLGLFYTQKNNALITLCKIGGIVYIFTILTVGIVPSIYDSYHENSLVPTASELFEIKKELREQLPKTENPVYSQLACIFTTQYADPQTCVKERQEKSRLTYICEHLKEMTPNTPEFEQCLKDQAEQQKRTLVVEGTVDPTRSEPMTAEFTIDRFFPSKTMRSQTDTPGQNYLVEFHITNPRQQQFRVEFSCSFKSSTSMGAGATAIPGEILGSSSISITQKNPLPTSVVCGAPGTLTGTYRLTYEAKLNGMKAASTLRRVFIGQKDQAWKEQWLPRITPTYFSGNQDQSQASADFARLNFAFGNPHSNPIVESASTLPLTMAIENVGTGKLLRIRHYKLDLEGFVVDDTAANNCLEGSSIDIPQTPIMTMTKAIYQRTCFITSLPTQLTAPAQDFEPKDFTATIEYDYVLTKEIPIEVQVLSS